MCIKLQSSVRFNQNLDLTSSESYVLLIMSLHAKPDGGSIFVSLATIAKQTRLHKTTVVAVIASLIKKGYIAKMPSAKKCNTYRLNNMAIHQNEPVDNLSTSSVTLPALVASHYQTSSVTLPAYKENERIIKHTREKVCDVEISYREEYEVLLGLCRKTEDGLGGLARYTHLRKTVEAKTILDAWRCLMHANRDRQREFDPSLCNWLWKNEFKPLVVRRLEPMITIPAVREEPWIQKDHPIVRRCETEMEKGLAFFVQCKAAARGAIQ